ncbi:hypothetical protein L207DRAFT_580690 [Hyaloscypha variabilis F]|uniref:Cora-domain-containing protein n=1 Tax=Hyaloscypha variabilis (strain UAMH 11265 / GT02V1 / F) TaxID=1149755 RepID=A0A2J6RU18_HYAVF|nr:hypothetical protein L207DRAFT_580690 [Hyaloscypha variabilis F]
METSSDVRPAGDFEQSQIQSTQIETLEVLRGIRGLLERIDGRLEDHGRRLIDIEKKTSNEGGKGKEKEIVEQKEKGKEKEELAENENNSDDLTNSRASSRLRVSFDEDEVYTGPANQDSWKKQHRISILPYKASTFSPDVLERGRWGRWKPAKGEKSDPQDEWPSDNFLTERLYDYWAVPSDGRIEIGFTKEGLSWAEDWQERIKEVEHFIADLAKIGAQFYIVDDGLEHSRFCFWIVPEPEPEPDTDLQQLIQAVQHEGLYRRTEGEIQDTQEIDQSLPPMVHKIIERSVANVERVLGNPGKLGNTAPIAPWRRTIVLTEVPQPLFLERLQNPCFTDDSGKKVIECNTWLSRRPRSLPYPKEYSMTSTGRVGAMHFSVPFFEIISSHNSRRLPARIFHQAAEDRDGGQWTFGKLYGDKDGRFLQYGACTILSTIDSYFESNLSNSQESWLALTAPFWTIIIVGSSKSTTDLFKRHSEPGGDDSVLDNMTRNILRVLERIEFCWRQINDHLNSLISENENFLDGDDYVKLLFEDESYTRSRTYFWILGCLRDFENTIRDTEKHWEAFQGSYIDLVKDDPAYKLTKACEMVTEIGILMASLDRIKSEFGAMRTQVTLLRDGLFNASSVVESRASTRLGENVKLLTYVSIFYLPLAFCAALWAIPNILEAGTKIAFVITSIVVGVITYAIVFNLDNLADKGWKLYKPVRSRVLYRMETGKWREEEDDEETLHKDNVEKSNNEEAKSPPPTKAKSWTKHAKKFHSFGPDRDKVKPSEWWILLYLLFLAYSWLLVTPSKSLVRSVDKLWCWLTSPEKVSEKERGKRPADDEPELQTRQRETV